jgi:hypothetical protein
MSSKNKAKRRDYYIKIATTAPEGVNLKRKKLLSREKAAFLYFFVF